MDDTQWRVTVDRDACVSSGACEGIAPRYFELQEGRSRAKAAEIEADEVVLVAAASCPVLAISVRAPESGDLIAPAALRHR
jgi:ferredoxin